MHVDESEAKHAAVTCPTVTAHVLQVDWKDPGCAVPVGKQPPAALYSASLIRAAQTLDAAGRAGTAGHAFPTTQFAPQHGEQYDGGDEVAHSVASDAAQPLGE